MQTIDKREAAERCWAAMAETDDMDTAQQLWRAGAYYFREARREAAELAFQSFEDSETDTAAGEVAGPSLAAHKGLSGLSRESW